MKLNIINIIRQYQCNHFVSFFLWSVIMNLPQNIQVLFPKHLVILSPLRCIRLPCNNGTGLLFEPRGPFKDPKRRQSPEGFLQRLTTRRSGSLRMVMIRIRDVYLAEGSWVFYLGRLSLWRASLIGQQDLSTRKTNCKAVSLELLHLRRRERC